jgi:predicted DNA-binding transcriptional regulator AlpA
MINVTTIPRAEIPAIICALSARLLAEPAPAIQAAPEPEEDRMLTTAEVADMLGHSTKWVYRHAAALPFARRIGPRDLRFELHGLRKWQARQKVNDRG